MGPIILKKYLPAHPYMAFGICFFLCVGLLCMLSFHRHICINLEPWSMLTRGIYFQWDVLKNLITVDVTKSPCYTYSSRFLFSVCEQMFSFGKTYLVSPGGEQESFFSELASDSAQFFEADLLFGNRALGCGFWKQETVQILFERLLFQHRCLYK